MDNSSDEISEVSVKTKMSQICIKPGLRGGESKTQHKHIVFTHSVLSHVLCSLAQFS